MLVRLKTPVEIQDSEFYKRLTIRINHQGVTVRDNEIGAKIGTKNQFRVRSGDFILSKIDARQGAFGIVPEEADNGIITGNFWTFCVDNRLVHTEWFLQFTNSDAFLDLCKRSSTGNTHRKYLNEAIFLNHELNIPSLEEQIKAVVSCKTGSKRVDEIQHEITHQQSLLAKLKQAILQEAIQGKLTEDWRLANPDVESASQLLQRIEQKQREWIGQEKALDNKEAKTLERKLNKLIHSPVKKPQETLPLNWQWATLLQANLLIVDCHNKTAPYVTSGIPIIRTTNVRNGHLDLENTKFITEETYSRWAARCIPLPGDLIFTREAPVGEVGQIPENAKVCLGQRTMLIRPVPDFVLPSYLLFVIQSPGFIARAAKAKHGAMVGHLRVSSVENAMIPLPPLAEQAAIVERVEALMTTSRLLESEIEQSRTHADLLLQAVLKEAFAPTSV